MLRPPKVTRQDICNVLCVFLVSDIIIEVLMANGGGFESKGRLNSKYLNVAISVKSFC